MRKIVFRGKRVDNGEWVYGCYCPVVRGKFPATPCIVPDCDGMWESIPIFPESVGQYTGLNDKNGNKIFEGDIVHYYCSDVTALVKFGLYVDIDVNKEAYGFYSEYKESEIGGSSEKLVQEVLDHRESDEEYGCEVIGNIHDNP